MVTQIRLSILSGDLPASTRLPSVRDVARRYGIHANTVSAAYGDLEVQGWLESRKGSGVYAKDLRAATAEESPLDAMVREFVAATRAQGFSTDEVRSSLQRALGGEPVRRLLIADPEPELRAILLAEMDGQLAVPMGVFEGRHKSGDAVAAVLGRADGLPPTLPRHFLKVRSLAEHLRDNSAPRPTH
jgi:GntR family transcriptional regulator